MLTILLAGAGLSPARSRAEETPRAAATSAAKPEDIQRWIKELGSNAYAIRQGAADQLLAAGMTAREALVDLSDGSDPETRAAARRLVALIDRTEFRRSLDAFAADTDGKRGLTLPGWDKYQKLVGGDPTARALFVDMQRQEGRLLAAAFGVLKRPPDELWEDRLQRVEQWQTSANDRGAMPPLGSCTAMVFLGCAAPMNVSDGAATIVDRIIQRSPMREAIVNENANESVRKLVTAWILNCPNNSDLALRSRLNLIATFNLEPGLPLALAVASGEPTYARIHPQVKAQAAQVIGQLGNRTHLDRLEPLLNDSSVCLSMQLQGPGQPPNVVQVRDVALVALLRLTDQPPSDYGYFAARSQPGGKFDIQTLFRENDQQRTDAVAKWQAWRAAHKNDKTPVESPAEPTEAQK